MNCGTTIDTENNNHETQPEEQKNDVKKCENEGYPMNICVETESTTSPKSLASEVSTQIDERPFKCIVCSKSFKLQKVLRYHQSLHKSTFECDNCGQNIKDRGTLMSHMNMHRDLKAFGCNLCHFTFSTVSMLGTHFRSIHGVGNKKQ